MRLSASRAAALGSLLLLLLGSAPTALVAQQNPAKEISESQQRLDQIRRERSKLRDELARLRSQVHDASSELRNIEQQVSTSADLLRELELQIAGTEQQIARGTQELVATQQTLAHRKTTLQRRLRDIYKRGPLHTPQVLLTAESFGDLLSRYKYLYLIARSDRALVRDVSDLEHQLVLRDRRLKRSLGELQVLQNEKSQEHGEMEHLEQQRKRALSTFRSREQSTSKRIQELAQDEKRVQTLIATLERKRKEAERLAAERRKKEAARLAAERARTGSTAKAAPAAPAKPASAGLSTRDIGNLGWPVDGTVIYRFGRSVQPNGTAVRLNGIGIAAPVGTTVKAVDAGTVVMAGPFEGYGPTVVVSHGGGYYSLYLYMKEVAVSEGTDVTRGQRLGSVGGSGTAEGPHLEFQIRAPGGQAVDPLAWLRQRGG
jgi:septal ring factor EnvC (AmiA/AmiB activator)